MQEEGTQEELIKLEGLYRSLVMRLVKGRYRRREHKRYHETGGSLPQPMVMRLVRARCRRREHTRSS